MFNKFLQFTQEKTKYLYENSLFLTYIDKLIFVSIVGVYLLSLVMSSDVIGFVALITIFLTGMKLLTTPKQSVSCRGFEIFLLAYFMLVIVSVFGSTLFLFSLKGFLKTLTYIGFYSSLVVYLKDNKDKIPFMFGLVGVCLCFESVVGFLQSNAKIAEISTWQDVSSLNPEQIMTRVYGTLKPYNPNLLGGYFVVGLPTLFCMSVYNFVIKKYKSSIAWLIVALFAGMTLFATGCRGAYLAFVAMVGIAFLISAKFLWKSYKKLYLSIVGFCCVLATFAILASASLRARIFSIFAMRKDSSNSFRFNVYQSSWQMFKDNWLLGIGVGNQNFREIYGLYMRTGFDALSAYNIYLETAVESGIFALFAFVGFLLCLIVQALKYILKSDNVRDIIFVSGALVSVSGVMVHGIVDTVFFRPQIQFIFWLMIAIASVILNEKDK